MPWVSTGLAAVVLLGVIIRDLGDGGAAFDLVNAVPSIASILLFVFLGTVILTRVPGNLIGWLLISAGLALLVSVMIQPYTGDVPPDDPRFVDYLALIVDISLGLNYLIYPLLLIPFLLPTGRFLTKWWSWPGWLGALFIPTTLLLSVVTEEIGPAFTEWTISNPIGFVPSGVLDAVFGVWVMVVYLMVPGSVWAMVARYRRSEAEVRAQIRWVLLGSIGFAISFVLLVVGVGSEGGLGGAIVAIGFGLIPVTITIAITRYRLYDVDRLLSRAIGYVLVLVVLGAVYMVGAVWLPTQFFDEQPPLFVAGSTLAVVALFSPLRKRVMGWVDRRFYRSRYRAEQVLASFTDLVRDEVAVDSLAAQWESAVTETLQPSAIGVWLQGGTE